MPYRTRCNINKKQCTKLAEALEVCYDWLMKGEEHKRVYPADQKMVDWLWEHEEVRKEIWKQMGVKEQADK